MADAPPPPLQIAAAPTFPLFWSKTESSVLTIRAPEALRDAQGLLLRR